MYQIVAIPAHRKENRDVVQLSSSAPRQLVVDVRGVLLLAHLTLNPVVQVFEPKLMVDA